MTKNNRWLPAIVAETMYAARSLAHSPEFSVAACASIGVALALASMTTAVVTAVQSPRTGYSDPQKLVQLDQIGVFASSTGQIEPWHFAHVTTGLERDLRASGLFSSLSSYHYQGVTIADDQVPNRPSFIVSHDMFRTLGVRPAAGRFFDEDHDRPGAGDVVVISYAAWQRRFGGDGGVVGERLRVRDRGRIYLHRIIGVLPEGIVFPPLVGDPEFYFPHGSSIARPVPSSTVIGRLAAGTSLEQVRARAGALAQARASIDRSIEQARLDSIVRTEPNAIALQVPTGAVTVDAFEYRGERPLSRSIIRLGSFLLCVTVLMLCMAAANVTNLFLMRGAKRSSELALRAALGANRWRIARLLLLESALLGTVGCALGLGLSGIYNQVLARDETVRAIAGSIDLRTGLLTAIVALILMALSSVAPVIRGTRSGLARSLPNRATTADPQLRSRLKVIASAAIACSVVLVMGASLLTWAAISLLLSNPGYDDRDVMVVDVLLAPEDTGRVAAAAALADVERTVHRVAGAGASIGKPPVRHFLEPVSVTVGAGLVDLGLTDVSAIGEEFFSILNLPLLSGRGFTSEETDSAAVIVVSRGVAKQLAGVGDPSRLLGQRLMVRIGSASIESEFTVVGVAAEVEGERKGAETWHRPAIYLPMGTAPARMASLLVKMPSPTTEHVARVVSAVRSTSASVRGVQSLASLTANRSPLQRLIGRGFALFGLSALLLTTLGSYAIMAYVAAERRMETGVRLALGAEPATIVRLFIADGLRMISTGIAAGLVLTVMLLPLLRASILGLDQIRQGAFWLTAGLVGGLGLLACYVPARRAAYLSPASVLQKD